MKALQHLFLRLSRQSIANFRICQTNMQKIQHDYNALKVLEKSKISQEETFNSDLRLANLKESIGDLYLKTVNDDRFIYYPLKCNEKINWIKTQDQTEVNIKLRIGNVQLLFTSMRFCTTRWRFDTYRKGQNYEKNL